jgi:hypothetical protein
MRMPFTSKVEKNEINPRSKAAGIWVLLLFRNSRANSV